MVVDHPAGTEVFVDERFADPDAVARADRDRPGAAAGARRATIAGRDVTALVAARDDRHLDFAGRGAYQGVTRRARGRADAAGRRRRAAARCGCRAAAGCIRPTARSTSRSGRARTRRRRASRSRCRDARRAASGRSRAGLGFPSGKDKTVLLDLAGVFPAGATGPRRLRLRTNLEIFWDRLGWAVGRPDVRVEPRRLPRWPRRSALPRLLGGRRQSAPSSPERPRYVLAGHRAALARPRGLPHALRRRARAARAGSTIAT